MTVDTVLYWIAFGLVVIGIALTFTRWWDRGYMFMALGLAVLGTACLWRGWWWKDAALAAFSFTSGLGIIYIAHREERKHGIRTEPEGEIDGGSSEEAGA